MRTADFIPVLLYHLKDEDKYGLQLIEATTKCSNGRVDIKQPTLYSVLKKLEQSKYITSYWKDSEIGGKRHYYHITTMGLAQLSTFPPLEELIDKIVEDKPISSDYPKDESFEDILTQKSNSSSPFDNFLFSPTSQEKQQESDVTESSEIASFEQENDYIETIEDDEQSVELQENEQLYELEVDEQFEKIDDNSYENTAENENFESIQDDTIEQNNNDSFGNDEDFEEECPVSEEDEEISEIEASNEEAESEEISTNSEETSPIILNDVTSSNEEPTSDEEDEKIIISPINQENIKNNNVSYNIFDALEPEEESEQLNLNNPFTNYVKEEQNKASKQEENQNYKTSLNEIFKSSKDVKISNTSNAKKIDVAYRDYIDYKKDKAIVTARKLSKFNFARIISSFTLTLMLICLSFVLSIKCGVTPLYLVTIGCFTIYIVFKFCKYVGDFKIKYVVSTETKTKYNFKNQAIVRGVISLVLIIVLLIINLIFIKNGGIFKKVNFANFFGILIVIASLFTDYLTSFIMIKLFNKKA